MRDSDVRRRSRDTTPRLPRTESGPAMGTAGADKQGGGRWWEKGDAVVKHLQVIGQFPELKDHPGAAAAKAAALQRIQPAGMAGGGLPHTQPSQRPPVPHAQIQRPPQPSQQPQGPHAAGQRPPQPQQRPPGPHAVVQRPPQSLPQPPGPQPGQLQLPPQPMQQQQQQQQQKPQLMPPHAQLALALAAQRAMPAMHAAAAPRPAAPQAAPQQPGNGTPPIRPQPQQQGPPPAAAPHAALQNQRPPVQQAPKPQAQPEAAAAPNRTPQPQPTQRPQPAGAQLPPKPLQPGAAALPRPQPAEPTAPPQQQQPRPPAPHGHAEVPASLRPAASLPAPVSPRVPASPEQDELELQLREQQRLQDELREKELQVLIQLKQQLERDHVERERRQLYEQQLQQQQQEEALRQQQLQQDQQEQQEQQAQRLRQQQQQRQHHERANQHPHQRQHNQNQHQRQQQQRQQQQQRTGRSPFEQASAAAWQHDDRVQEQEEEEDVEALAASLPPSAAALAAAAAAAQSVPAPAPGGHGNAHRTLSLDSGGHHDAGDYTGDVGGDLADLAWVKAPLERKARSEGLSPAVLPKFPGPRITKTHSSSRWAVLLTNACNLFESGFGPLLAGIVAEYGLKQTQAAEGNGGREGPEAPRPPPPDISPELSKSPVIRGFLCVSATSPVCLLGRDCGRRYHVPPKEDNPEGVQQPHVPPGDMWWSLDFPNVQRSFPLLEEPWAPYSAAACLSLLLRHGELRFSFFPTTMFVRVKRAAAAARKLFVDPERLTSADVLSGQTAMRDIIKDCVNKAFVMRDLLGGGSEPFQAFIQEAGRQFARDLQGWQALMDAAAAPSAGEEGFPRAASSS